MGGDGDEKCQDRQIREASQIPRAIGVRVINVVRGYTLIAAPCFIYLAPYNELYLATFIQLPWHTPHQEERETERKRKHRHEHCEASKKENLLRDACGGWRITA